MKATIFSLLLASIVWFFLSGIELSKSISDPLLPLASVFLLFLPLIFALAWTPLQKGEQNITPRLIEMFGRDRKIKGFGGLLFLFPLTTFVIYLLIGHIDKEFTLPLLMGWIVLLGLALDITWALIKRITSYLDPFKATEIISESANSDVRSNNLEKVIDSIDSLSEISSRALDRGNASLSQQAVAELRDVGVHFLSSSKSFANLSQDLSESEKGNVDKVAYTLFSLLSRLEMIGVKGAVKHINTVVSQTLTALGRLAISAANYDLTLVAHPILSIGKISRKALDLKETESAIKGEIVLLQLAKAIVKDVDLAYGDLKSPFISLLNQLEEIEKERFQQDKEINLNILTQPFEELKDLFNSEKIKGHQDTPILLTEIDRILAEFRSLGDVLRTLPKLPETE